MFVSLLIYYYVYLPLVVKNNIILIVILFCISILLLINEKYNCKDMLLNYGIFPYHIFIEIVGLFLFYIICSSFYKL
jgi:hypothetical protein